ncbi:MAG: toxin-antitoxin system YwqK family antitoxin [Bacteroidia bacterium]
MIVRLLVLLLVSGFMSPIAPVYATGSSPAYREMNDSTQNGRYRQYNDSHQLVFEGHYKNGIRQGIFKEYDASGLLITKAKYKQGKLRWTQLYKNGKIYAVIDRKGVYRKRKDCGC